MITGTRTQPNGTVIIRFKLFTINKNLKIKKLFELNDSQIYNFS